MGTAADFNADFSKFLGEFTKVEIKLRAFDAEADKAGAAAQKLGDSLNGNRIAEQAAVAVRALQAIEGGAKALTQGELRRMSATIDEAVEKFGKMGRQVPADMAAVKASIDQIKASTEQTTTPAGKLTELFTQGLGMGAGVTVIDLAVKGVTALGTQMTLAFQEGQKLSALGTAFTNLSGGVGPAAEKMLDMRKATRGLVSDMDLMQAANKASLLGLDAMGVEFDQMAGIAAKLGKAMGQDAAKSVDDLTTALSRQSPMILDNLGLSVKLSDAYESYAASLGKSATALTEEEKKQAFATAAMDAAQKKAAVLGDQTLTLGEQFDRLGNLLKNTRAELGRSANESGVASSALGALTGSAEVTLKAMMKVTEEYGKNVEAARKAGLETENTAEAQGSLITKLVLLGLRVPETVVFLGKLEQATRAYGAAQAYLRGELDQTPALKAPSAHTGDIRLAGRMTAAGTPSGLTPEQEARASAWLKKDSDDRAAKYEADNEARIAALLDGGKAAAKVEAQQQKERERKDQEHRERLAKLSGGDQIAAALQSALDIKELKGALGPDQAAALFQQMFDAREIAKAIQPGAVAGITKGMQAIATNPGVEKATRDAGKKLIEGIKYSLADAKASDFAGAVKPGVFDSVVPTKKIGESLGLDITKSILGVLGKPIGGDITFAKNIKGDLIPQNALANTYALRKGLDGLGIPLDAINERFDTFIDKQRDWTDGIDGAAHAFATLATTMQGAGVEMDRITAGVGAFFGGVDAGKQFADSIGNIFGQSDWSKTTGGKAAGGAMAGFATGSSIAALTGTTSAWKGAAVGAGSGALAGAAFGGIGAGFGAAAGAIGGAIAANRENKRQREIMAANRKELLRLYGSRDELIKQAARLGVSQDEIDRNILNNAKNVKAYTATVDKLTDAEAAEQRQADKMAETLGKVTKARGVLDQAQSRELAASLTVGSGPRFEAAQEFLTAQRDSLLAGLGGLAAGPMTSNLVQFVGNALPAAFAELKAAGLSSIDALRQLQPLLDNYQKNGVAQGLGSTEGFDELNATLGILKDEKLGPLVQQTELAAQSMAALQNLGYGNQRAFDQFSVSVTDTFAALTAGGATSEQALALLHQPLQNAWQLAKDFGYETDAATQALLDQAEAAGTVGDAFRPAEDRMAQSLDTIVDRLEDMIELFTGDLVGGATTGAQEAGKAIIDTFANVKPVVTVRYEYETPQAPDVMPRGGGDTSTVQRATDGTGDIYMDGERVGIVVGRHLGRVSDYAGA